MTVTFIEQVIATFMSCFVLLTVGLLVLDVLYMTSTNLRSDLQGAFKKRLRLAAGENSR